MQVTATINFNFSSDFPLTEAVKKELIKNITRALNGEIECGLGIAPDESLNELEAPTTESFSITIN